MNTLKSSSLKIGKDKLTVTPLGAGMEVGRSAVVVKFKGKQIMFDCGVHPAYKGKDSLPYFDHIRPEKIDLVLVTHFHLDHCGSLPYFVSKTNFKGKVYMTHPTKEIYKLNMNDSCRMATDDKHVLYTKEDLDKSLKEIELINYHEEKEYRGIKFYCMNAGHVLGAAMFMIEIAGIRVLYTGDFSREPDRHLMGAEVPRVKPHVIIVESTYGIRKHSTRKEREIQFVQKVKNIVVQRKGNCLIPVFALGRAQELLLILEDYWEKHGIRVPIYYGSSLAEKARGVFKKYIAMMNRRIQRQFEISNPFEFKHISHLSKISDIQQTPCVVMASPGMLQSGMSLQLFEKWCQDNRNGLVIPGYSVKGTLANTLLQKPKTVPLSDGQEVELRMPVYEVSFSAHSDCDQTTSFIEEMLPCRHVVLVHGAATNAIQLKKHLESKFKGQIEVHTPANTQDVTIEFQSQIKTKIIGQLAQEPPKQGRQISGVLVKKDFQQMLISPQDLPHYFDVNRISIRQKMYVPLPLTKKMRKECNNDLISYWYKRLSTQFSFQFEGEKEEQVNVTSSKKESVPSLTEVEDGIEKDQMTLTIGGEIQFTLNRVDPQEALIEWDSKMSNDLLVNAIIISILDEHPEQQHEHAKELAEASDEDRMSDDVSSSGVIDRQKESQLLYLVQQLLMEHYENIEMDIKKKQLSFEVNQVPVLIDCVGNVSCEDAALRDRLKTILKRIVLCLCPLPNQFGCLDE